ncbi:hypothetical protein [uncultured Succinatimonas sp.]|uniref:hypothetical protein n=1 Tax=uncultured Succinatimonas sp. TaxID=1262973 RepID=UPI0025D1E5F7|nr:hypothetical protein [uncultured Succinatimonas sp.]
MTKFLITALICLSACTNLKSTSFSVKEETSINLFAPDDYSKAFNDFSLILKHKLSFGKNSFSVVGFDHEQNKKFSSALMQKGASVCSGQEFCSGISLRLEIIAIKENSVLISINTPKFILNRIYQKKHGSIHAVSAFTFKEK